MREGFDDRGCNNCFERRIMPLEIIFLWGLRAENFIKKRKKNRRKLSLLDWWVREEESRIVGAAYLNLKRQAPTSEQLYPTKMPTSTRCPHWRLGGEIFKICSIFLSHYLGWDGGKFWFQVVSWTGRCPPDLIAPSFESVQRAHVNLQPFHTNGTPFGEQ